LTPAETAEHWRRSYLNTRHGKPIAFSRDWQDQHELAGEVMFTTIDMTMSIIIRATASLDLSRVTKAW
jgi:hypothetical protein